KVNLKSEDNHLLDTFGRRPIAVCLANNHIMDYCEEGFQDTLANLEAHGIKYFGAGSLANKCNNPLMLDVAGLNVALMGYAGEDSSPILASPNSLGAMPLDADALANDIAAARDAGAERVVVSLHWGAEDVYLHKPQDVRLAHDAIDAGADLIIGHHSHCIQPYEIYKGKHIFYGLGNCIFTRQPAPGDFDDTGTPTVIYPALCLPWHQLSLAAAYEPVTGRIVVSVLKFDGTVLRRTNRNARRYMEDLSCLDGYEKRFKRSYAYGKLCRTVVEYLRHPRRIPRPRHFMALVSLAFRRKYSSYK
ncbi:MAG TPA: CapA family protein, partial [Anaerolineales bacterium]|nr:CapA family protein [Anaerolineales bacterium]